MAGEILSDSLRSVPDGETGERIQWFLWQQSVFERAPFLQRSVLGTEGNYTGLPRYRVREELSGGRFDKLGYADAAIASYKVFTALRGKGKIPARVRFQVSLPTPLAPLTAMIEPADYLKVEPLYEEAMRREIELMCAAIPADDLALQWDVSVELGLLEGTLLPGGKSVFSNPMEEVIRRLGKVIDWVPQNVRLGIHLCYGDYQHKHWMEPKDTGLMVDVANTTFAIASRKVDWLHLPVPRNRDDDAYFAPLEKLELSRGTQLYLGLVHLTDGVKGAKRRIEAAERHITGFGIATECGLGRRPAETIPDVMKLMATLASP
jgi:hypothetical protein